MKVDFSPGDSAVFLQRTTYCLSWILSSVPTFPGSRSFSSSFTHLLFAHSTVHFAVFKETCTKLISVPAEIMEDLSSIWRIRKWLEKSNILSCRLANLIHCCDVTNCSMCNSRAVDDTYLDFSNVFDMVSYKILLNKLRRYELTIDEKLAQLPSSN